MATNKKGLSAAAVAVGIMSTTLIPQNAYAHGFESATLSWTDTIRASRLNILT